MPKSNERNDQPIDRMLTILEAVARRRQPVTASEIAAAVGLPTPTVHRMVGHLVDRAVLKRALGSKRVLPGPRLAALSALSLEAIMAADRPHVILTSLASEIGENCHLGIVSDNAVLYVASARSSQTTGLQFEPGRRSPLHCSSIGKVYLADMDEPAFRKWLAAADLRCVTEQTETDRTRFEGTVTKVREKGWASSDGELELGVVGCAVPVRNADGMLVAALGLSAPSARFSRKQVEGFVPRLAAAAREIAEALESDGARKHGD